jgi:TnpA family transposase
VARALDEDELIEHWTLVGDELGLLTGRTGPVKLGLALWLKFFIAEGRFPSGRSELPDEAVAWVARQLKVPASDIGLFDWEGRTAERFPGTVRAFLGFRECSVADGEKLAVWLAGEVCGRERHPQRVREALLAHMRAERIQQPTRLRLGRIIGSALRQSDEALYATVSSRLDEEVKARLWTLIETADDDPGDQAGNAAAGPGEATGPEIWAAVRSDPGGVSLNTCKAERRKLDWIRAVGLPAGLFNGIGPKIVAEWRARTAVEAPSHLRGDHSPEGRWTLMAAYLHCREREITDTLADLLIATVHRINAHAETKTKEQFTGEIIKKVTGKENILFRIASASAQSPGGIVEDVVFPAAGGLDVLLDLVREFETKGPTYRQARQRSFKSSYSNHYRAGLIQILEALEFRSNNTVHRPVLEALELIKRYKAERSPSTVYYARGEHVPVDGVIPRLADLLHKTDKRGRRRVQRTVYECGVFQTLRDKLRCKEIWVVGADRWRNPDEDLPADFEERRAENYASLRKPLDPQAFTAQLRAEMEEALAGLNDHLPELDWVDIRERKAGPIVLTDLDAVPEPRNLRRLKTAIRDRWGMVPLLDMLTETALRTGCLDAFTPAGRRSDLPPAVLFQRLLLAVYAYGTNTGIRAVAAADHGHGEDELRYIRRRYMTVESCRQAARVIANATFAARQGWLWGEGSTAVASDSTHFRAWDQNIFTEWHSRYRNGKRGVLIYWTVEKGGAMAVHSQLLECSASEVHAMVEGAMRHGTDMEVEANYVDTHGHFIGFGITRLLGFDLLPRIKQINRCKLYLPAAGDLDRYPRLRPALTNPIRWGLIEQNYDLMVKYATAIRLGTASTEAILRRFNADVTHPAYAAMLEVGRAQRTIFIARYLRDRDPQREINAGLNVVENYNGVNDYIFFGKSGELSTNRREEQEISMICLQILQSCLGYVNTLMIQDTLAEPEWADRLGDADRRGLTPLFTVNMTPYGEIQLNLDRRLGLAAGAVTASSP